MSQNSSNTDYNPMICLICSGDDYTSCGCIDDVDGHPDFDSRRQNTPSQEYSDSQGTSDSENKSEENVQSETSDSKNRKNTRSMKRRCTNCKKYGHATEKCWSKGGAMARPCKYCGGFGHSPAVCRYKPKAKTGKPTREKKGKDLVDKSRVDAQTRSDAEMDAVLEEIESLKEQINDKKDVEKEAEEEMKAKYARESRFKNFSNVKFLPKKIGESLPDIPSFEKVKDKFLSLFKKASTKDTTDVHVEQVDSNDEEPQGLLEFLESTGDATDEKDESSDVVDGERGIFGVSDEESYHDNGSGIVSEDEDDAGDDIGTGSENSRNAFEDEVEYDSANFDTPSNPMFGEFDMLPPPSEVVDEYDENEFALTFTSPITFPEFYGSIWAFICAIPFRVLFLILGWMVWSVGMVFVFAPFFIMGILSAINPLFLGSSMLYANACFLIALTIFLAIGLFYNTIIMLLIVFRFIKDMVRWKNTYTFVRFLAADLSDLRTDNQLRSEFRHKDAIYAEFTFSRRLHVSYTANYKNSGFVTMFMTKFIIWLMFCLGDFIPGWLQEFDRKGIVVSLEAFDQAKELLNTDPTSSDIIAGDKIKTSLKKMGTIWINRHLKHDPIYMTMFLVWAYFKANQQKVEDLPFPRPP